MQRIHRAFSLTFGRSNASADAEKKLQAQNLNLSEQVKEAEKRILELEAEMRPLKIGEASNSLVWYFLLTALPPCICMQRPTCARN